MTDEGAVVNTLLLFINMSLREATAFVEPWQSLGRVPLVGVVCDDERITVDLLSSAVFVNT